MTLRILLLAALTVGFSVSLSGRPTYHDRLPGDSISPLNYSLRSALRPHATYAGVLISSQPVKVMRYRRGLLPLFATGVTDALVGTRYAEVYETAHAYTIRLDTPGSRTYRLVTVVQGPETVLTVNQPVFVITEGLYSYQGRHGFSVRVAPYSQPKTIRTSGVTERDFLRR